MRRPAALLLALATATSLAAPPPAERRQPVDVATALSGDSAGFARALEPRPFVFPRDHGPHPAFRNEWWYLTGQLFDEAGRHYGFQYTLFRVGLRPGGDGNSDALWPRDSIWMAHAALSDTNAKQLWHAQRLSHGGAGSAGARGEPFAAWLDDWSLHSAQTPSFFPWRLALREEHFALDLELDSDKLPVAHGERGLSRKGGDDNASYYYSYTDLAVRGELDGRAVQGRAWFDREWSTSVLPDGVAGWDWLSLQLHDGRQLMVFQLRAEQAEQTARSRSGTLVSARGDATALRAGQIRLQALQHWDSAHSGGRYPVQWRLVVDDLGRELLVEATFPEQELHGLVNYWEGAVRVRDAETGEPLGRGYLEMTGYARAGTAD